jgi:septal ring factor EnvC (AmiA/AmiB activator)
MKLTLIVMQSKNILLKITTIIAVLLFWSLRSFSQQPSKSELEKEHAAIQQEIEDVKRSLDETKRNRKETLGQLALLQRKLRLREAAIQNTNQQINYIQSDMSQSLKEIFSLRKELDTLKKQYEESVVYAYKNRSSYDFLNFIFAATSFNDAVKRVEYLKTYRTYREERAENIRKTQVLLQGKISGLKVKREQKDVALQKQNKERTVLEDEKKEKDEFIGKLKSHEKELKKEMADRKRQDDKLQSALRAAINREIKLARERDVAEQKKRDAAGTAVIKNNATKDNSDNTNTSPKTATTAKPKSVFEATPEGQIVSADFEKNRGKFPWPVETISFIIPFGINNVEGLNNIKEDNHGITIGTQIGATVHAIFDGEVSSVFNIEGSMAVFVRHGKYFTAYSNLSAVSVAKGDKVKTGQLLGRAGENENGNGEINFILMNENKNVNPELWLRRR